MSEALMTDGKHWYWAEDESVGGGVGSGIAVASNSHAEAQHWCQPECCQGEYDNHNGFCVGRWWLSGMRCLPCCSASTCQHPSRHCSLLPYPHGPTAFPPSSLPADWGAVGLKTRAMMGGFLTKVWAALFRQHWKILNPVLPLLWWDLAIIYRTQWWQAMVVERLFVHTLCQINFWKACPQRKSWRHFGFLVWRKEI